MAAHTYEPTPTLSSYSSTLQKNILSIRSGIDVRYPKLVVFAVSGQIAMVIALILANLPGPNGTSPLWQSNAVVDDVAAIIALFAIGNVLWCMVYALIQATKLRRWGWFIGVLLGTLVGSFIAPGIALIAFGLRGPTPSRR